MPFRLLFRSPSTGLSPYVLNLRALSPCKSSAFNGQGLEPTLHMFYQQVVLSTSTPQCPACLRLSSPASPVLGTVASCKPRAYCPSCRYLATAASCKPRAYCPSWRYLATAANCKPRAYRPLCRLPSFYLPLPLVLILCGFPAGFPSPAEKAKARKIPPLFQQRPTASSLARSCN